MKQRVEVNGKIGLLLGFVRGEYRDKNAYPAAVMISATMAIVAFGNDIAEFPLHLVKLK